MNTSHLPLTVTVTEAGRQLAISRRTVYKLMDSGELASIKIGRARRITRQAIADYLERQQNKSAS